MIRSIISLIVLFISFCIYALAFYPGLYFATFIFIPLIIINIICIIVAYVSDIHSHKYTNSLTAINLVSSILSLIPILGYVFLTIGVITTIVSAGYSFSPIYIHMFHNE